MDTMREKRLNDLLGQALAQAPEKRFAFLQSECRDDGALLREVWELACGEDGLGSFLESPPDLEEASKNLAADVEHLENPTRIDGYRILRPLGEGGMGRVFLAEQTEPVERQVALKLIRSGLQSPRAEARFEAERQALARLSHPNIGQIFDAGTTERGFPYFVMELVPGESITAYCDHAELSIERRLELFIQVCDGVQHAHHKQILHRDLKPSNILVTELEGRPTVKIIDFGVAKALDRPLVDATLMTRDGLVGTPSYMSPEVLLGHGEDVDTRSDVYALGILLYELLTGVRPFETQRDTLGLILKKIAEEEARPPSSRLSTLDPGTRTGIARYRRSDVVNLYRRLTGDLDWIVLKAIAKERDERYGSPAELAADVERHLHDQPVLAHAPSTWYRARKFVRRHRVGVAASTLVVVALVLGVLGTLAGWWKARQAETRALANAQTAEQVIDFMVDLFEISDPGEARGAEVTAREVLDRGAEKVRLELADQPLIRARLLQTLGFVYSKLGVPDEAEALLREALDLRRSAGADRRLVAESLEALAAELRDLNRLDEAEAMLEEALSLVAGVPGEEEMWALVLHSKARLYTDLERYDEARELYARSIEMRQRLFAGDDPDLADSLNNQGLVLTQLEEFDAAEAILRRAIAMQERLYGDDHPHLANSLSNLGVVFYRQGQVDKALEYIQRDLDISEKVLGPSHPDLAISYNNVATLKGRLGDFEGALETFEKSISIAEQVYGTDHPSLAGTLANLGRTAEQWGDSRRALEALERAAAIGRRHRPEHSTTLRHLQQYGSALASACAYETAEVILGEALAILERLGESDDVRYGETLVHLGRLEVLRGNWDRAATRLREARSRLAGREGEAGALLWQARLELSRGDVDGARRDLEAVLELDPESFAARLELARVESETGRWETARGHVDRALELLEEKLAERRLGFQESLAQAEARFLFGQIHAGEGELETARAEWGRALEQAQGLGRRFDRPEARDLEARAFLRLGEIDRAQATIRSLRNRGCRVGGLEGQVSLVGGG